MRAEWFRKALDGGFQESHSQSLELPEEEPGIFHFIVAYLYENRYVPTKPLSSVLSTRIVLQGHQQQTCTDWVYSTRPGKGEVERKCQQLGRRIGLIIGGQLR